MPFSVIDPDALNAIGGVVAVTLVVGIWIGLDWLGNRWFKALSESIKQRGLIGVVWQRLRGGTSRNRNDQTTSKR